MEFSVNENGEYGLPINMFKDVRPQTLAFGWIPQLAMIFKYVNTDNFGGKTLMA
ncbi:21227_t:CDS:2 [Racocetra persica]|uniref:21227_t:CDS:1 n=1 Tax=Racocetra persica TaxID=160502 RepID=A0ACA9P1P9_9GLOM|nr:21227_t:CDS:2 [Racocetra persica]